MIKNKNKIDRLTSFVVFSFSGIESNIIKKIFILLISCKNWKTNKQTTEQPNKIMIKTKWFKPCQPYSQDKDKKL